MSKENQPLETLQDIKSMMNRSSRFISLSGLSGVSAGVCALAGASFAYRVINRSGGVSYHLEQNYRNDNAGFGVSLLKSFMGSSLFWIAVLTFVSAFCFAFVFTYFRSRKEGIPVWGASARRLTWNVLLPMAAGGIFLLKLIEAGVFGLIAPGCLIFYGIALVNGSKFTLGEIRYLGYAIIILGLVNCWFQGAGLYFWAIGFGIFHIAYGIMMWSKYERN
ncbi:MAG: hypothetical protein QM725_11365 [Lacibacter sp.]